MKKDKKQPNSDLSVLGIKATQNQIYGPFPISAGDWQGSRGNHTCGSWQFDLTLLQIKLISTLLQLPPSSDTHRRGLGALQDTTSPQFTP